MSTPSLENPELKCPNSVSATVKDEWTIKLYDLRGQCCVDIETKVPWQPSCAQIGLYEGDPPCDPTKYKTYTPWAPGNKTWETGKDWGNGWSAALIAQQGNDNPPALGYHYVVKTTQTVSK